MTELTLGRRKPQGHRHRRARSGHAKRQKRTFCILAIERLEERMLLDGSVTGSIDVPGQVDTYTFNLPINSRLYFDSLTSNGNLNWTLSGPAGTAVSARGFNNSDAVDGFGVLTLFAGDYTLTVDASNEATGPYSFRLLDLAQAETITPGTPVNGDLTPANETDMFRFDAT